jgi:hypothetical protein
MSPDCHAMGTPTTQPAGSSAARGWAGGGLRRATHPCSDGDTTALSYVPLACAAATLASEIVLAYGPCATIASDFGSSERAVLYCPEIRFDGLRIFVFRFASSLTGLAAIVL